MRLKTFKAPSMAEAMKMVKEHFGDDAIIVSSQKGDGGLGVRVTAAIEPRDDDYDDDWDAFADEEQLDPFDVISEALAHHGVPPDLMDKILRTASAHRDRRSGIWPWPVHSISTSDLPRCRPPPVGGQSFWSVNRVLERP